LYFLESTVCHQWVRKELIVEDSQTSLYMILHKDNQMQICHDICNNLEIASFSSTNQSFFSVSKRVMKLNPSSPRSSRLVDSCLPSVSRIYFHIHLSVLLLCRSALICSCNLLVFIWWSNAVDRNRLRRAYGCLGNGVYY
jgi:hypothetical protein